MKLRCQVSIASTSSKIQKQSFTGFLKNNCLEKFQKITMKTSLKEIHFSKSEDL